MKRDDLKGEAIMAFIDAVAAGDPEKALPANVVDNSGTLTGTTSQSIATLLSWISGPALMALYRASTAALGNRDLEAACLMRKALLLAASDYAESNVEAWE